jgi:hypothetical protein
LRAVVDKAFGDLELDPTRVTLVAAANPSAYAAGGWDLAAPLANRFMHYTFDLQPQEWCSNFPNYWGEPPKLRFGQREVREEDWARCRTRVATGVLFDTQSADAIVAAIRRFEASTFDSDACRINAARFSEARFRAEFAAHFDSLWHGHPRSSRRVAGG